MNTDRVIKLMALLPDEVTYERRQQLLWYLERYPDTALTVQELAQFVPMEHENKTHVALVKEHKIYDDMVKNFLQNTQTLIKCKYCKLGGVRIIVKQTRSADEGSTQICLCPHCGRRWKMG
jgi:DNA-directed RNA polymerase subunit M/transcription elongation factor TFIIS